jgi:hypothetical protein
MNSQSESGITADLGAVQTETSLEASAMTQRESQQDTPSFPELVPPQIVDPKRMERMEEEIAEAQAEFFRYVHSSTQFWIDRMEAEADLVSEFRTKLAAARSFPDTASSVQECTKRQMEMLAEDSKRLFDDSQKFAQIMARFLSRNWLRADKNGGL